MEEVLNELREIKKLLHAMSHRAEQQEGLRRQGLRILLVFLAFQHPDFLEDLSSKAMDIDTLTNRLYETLKMAKRGAYGKDE